MSTIFKNLIFELPYILLWIGLWGIIDNIINKYYKINHFNLRIFIYSVILFIGIIFYCLLKNTNK